MRCPFCHSDQSSVIDKRAVKSSGEVRRRRECLKCHKRYTTYEKPIALEIMVIKRDGRKEIFDRLKLQAGLQKSLEKRPGCDQIETIINKIEGRILSKGIKEIQSKFLGQAALSELKKIDTVAYLRFASVYRQFEKIDDFTKELEHLKI